jgi:hypothetical protein
MLSEQKLTKQILTDQIPNKQICTDQITNKQICTVQIPIKQIPEPDNQRVGFIKSLGIDQHPSLSALRVGVEEFAS